MQNPVNERGLFRPSDRHLVRQILRGKRLGFSISEIREIIQMYKEPPGEVGQLKLMIKRIEEKREDLRQKRRDLEETLAELDQAEESCVERLAELVAQLPQTPVLIRGSLWRGSAPTVFLIENGMKRPFASEAAFLQRGFRFEDVTEVPDEDLQRLPAGPTLFEQKRRASGRRKVRRGKGRGMRRRHRRSSGRRSVRSGRRKRSGSKARRRRR